MARIDERIIAAARFVNADEDRRAPASDTQAVKIANTADPTTIGDLSVEEVITRLERLVARAWAQQQMAVINADSDEIVSRTRD